MADSTGRDSDKFMLRLPDGMRDLISEEARQNRRSMNAEIIARLRQTLDGPENNAKNQVDAEDLYSRLAAEISRLQRLVDEMFSRKEL